MGNLLSRLLLKKKVKAVGNPPGTLVYTGEKKIENVKVTIIDYDESNLREIVAEKIEECFPFRDTKTVTWINIDGLHDLKLIEKIGTEFNIHPLVLEDIVNVEQRPKIDEYKDYIFVILRMVYLADDTKGLDSEQVSLIIGENYVISFQEKEGDVFNEVRERIKKGYGRIRKMGSDYLAYCLIDAVVDNYFIILENLGEELEYLEEEVLESPTSKTSEKIHIQKRYLINLRRSVWPLREIITKLERGESDFINESTIPFLKDLYDHIVQIIESVELFREVISGILDTYLSSVSTRMNEVMKVLTLIATIFIPITFIVGVYGMNFRYIPELEWKWGYFSVWGVILTVSVFMLVIFKRKKWL